VARGALGTGGARWLPVRRPDLYAADVFRTLASSHGIVLDPVEPVEALPDGTELARLDSPPLDAILAEMLRYSTNLTAEVAGLAATAAGGRGPADIVASAAAMNGWLGAALGGRQPGMLDHSGLSGGSRMAAVDMVGALVRIGSRSRLASLLQPFRIEDAPVSMAVSAKTGTLNFVSALTGYLTAPTGRELAFAILTSDIARRATLTEAERDSPPGGQAWAGRSRSLQRALLANWAVAHA
jgi:D-alanyl-D-alanine carboxypeptidase/D-alanyl-D-alanine-endopeptidase (penicillin-binding protein 4)